MAWVFSLPVFPSQDGSMHLYTAQIIANLLASEPRFSHYFYIQHTLPPYSLHYYLLAAATQLVAPRLAEKLLVCGTSVILATGFRSFTRTTGDADGVVSLSVLPLLFHQPLLMGFYNFSLSLGITFWALAFWCEASRERRPRDWFIFLVLTWFFCRTRFHSRCCCA
jgi:hypothetical protein